MLKGARVWLHAADRAEGAMLCHPNEMDSVMQITDCRRSPKAPKTPVYGKAGVSARADGSLINSSTR